MDEMTIRPERPGDWSGIHAVHAAAFGGTVEADLVDRVRADGDLHLGLVATADGVIGHAAFPRLALEGSDLRVVALAPLAVRPGLHRAGVGSALVRAALDRLRAEGEDLVLVRGHTTYYPRFGFSTETAQRFNTPFDGPGLHALALSEKGSAASGRITYPRAFSVFLR
ncbi:MAG TPA: N-acetyltransferase [Microvirga sp.]|jgi:putative acetyltransferase